MRFYLGLILLFGVVACTTGESIPVIKSVDIITNIIQPTNAISRVEVMPQMKNGALYFTKGQYAEAINEYSLAINQDNSGDCGTGVKGAAFWLRAEAYYFKQDYENAIIDFKIAVIFIKNNPELSLIIGNCYFKMGMLDEALRYYKEASSLAPDSYEAYNNIGLLYTLKNDYISAIENYTKALLINSNQTEIVVNRAYLYFDYGDYPKAESEFLNALSSIQDADVYMGLSITYIRQTNTVKAKEYYLLAVRANPLYEKDLSALSDEGYLYSEKQKAAILEAQKLFMVRVGE